MCSPPRLGVNRQEEGAGVGPEAVGRLTYLASDHSEPAESFTYLDEEGSRAEEEVWLVIRQVFE